MEGLRISQLAERVGVPASTVRHYERIGLLSAPARTASNYRVYDDDAETRLRFVTRSKRLGLTLEEIADLAAIWDGTHCAATQERLSALLDAKRLEIAEKIVELERFAGQLAEVQMRLAATPPSEGCAADADLACCVPPLAVEPVSFSPGPIACTLAPGERPAREAEFAALAGHVTSWSRDETTLRISFPAEPGLEAALADLTARERRCCAFLSFTLRSAHGTLCWEIEAPGVWSAPSLDEFLTLLPPAREAGQR